MMDLFCRFDEMREICRVEICLVDEDCRLMMCWCRPLILLVVLVLVSLGDVVDVVMMWTTRCR